LPATSVWDTYNSFYFHLFSRTGLPGLALFLWLTVSVARDAKRRLPLLGNWAGAAAGLLCGFVGVQIALLTNPVYQLPGGGVNFWLALGLAHATSRIDAAPAACQGDSALDEAGAGRPEAKEQRGLAAPGSACLSPPRRRQATQTGARHRQAAPQGRDGPARRAGLTEREPRCRGW